MSLSTLFRHTVRRRPISSLTATVSVAAFGYANYREWKANDDLTTIPRDHYDSDAIASYWEQRPISIMKRLMSIASGLGPVAGGYLLEFHLRPWISRSLDLEDDATTVEGKRAKQILESELSQKLRSSLTELGPTFVKIGQQLSIRPDLVSPTVLYELQRLCDAVPPFADKTAMRVLAEELLLAKGDGAGNNIMFTEKEVSDTILAVFQEMPELVASASLGQVYKAALKSNNKETISEVAIKVQRPDILETVSLDLFLLVSYGKIVDKLCSVLTHQIPYHEIFLNGFANGAFMELNYIQEAENQMYFRKELHSRFHGENTTSSSVKYNISFPSIRRRSRRKNVEKIIVPEVHERYTTQRILVSEWIDGTPLARAPPEQIRELIPIGVELFLCQLLDIGRFHADPHPGNLYVTKSKIDGKTPTLCLLDFGLVAHVSESARNSMTQAIVNLLQGDYDTLIAHDAKHLGFLPQDMDVTDLKPVLKTILKEGLVDAGSNLHDRRRNLMAISNELNEVFFQYPFSVPPFFALVTRGLGLLEGIALTGDPSFDIFRASYPYAKRRAIESFSVKDYGKISRSILSFRRAPTEFNECLNFIFCLL
mmetsp:Transcript_22244/g.53893  ORF Transcript_22244/g.53893 Transcript_22244/m.53893 type:complete len:597 (-) Transcript_22244:79-1869(-)